MNDGEEASVAATAPPLDGTLDEGDVPLLGYTERRCHIPVVETLSDDELRELNRVLPWSCFVVDSNGRRFGQPAAPTRAGKPKRTEPNKVPDVRTVVLDERFGLNDLTVLEIGCFEGVHTAALAQRARHVKACDSRVVNLAKTAVRCAMFQVSPTIFHWNVEEDVPEGQDVSCDLLHHVGVLYHLADPVSHLMRISPFVKRGLLLDTHYSADDDANQSYVVNGRTFACREVFEGGVESVFSGMYPTSRWLRLDDLVGLLEDLGFGGLDVQPRMERHGPRVLIVGERGAN